MERWVTVYAVFDQQSARYSTLRVIASSRNHCMFHRSRHAVTESKRNHGLLSQPVLAARGKGKGTEYKSVEPSASVQRSFFLDLDRKSVV